MYNYQSDITKFLNNYLEKNPEIAQDRPQNHNVFLDIELDLEDEKNFAAAKLSKNGYFHLKK